MVMRLERIRNDRDGPAAFPRPPLPVVSDTEHLQSDFTRAFGGRASRVARAPGRVNLIGEHVDYCGLSVFPMAIQRGVWMLFRPRADGLVRVVNTGPFEPREFAAEPDPPPYPVGDWGNYLKAAMHGLAGHYGVTRGMDALVWSDLPVAAGLSSSSALVVAAALALLDANEATLDRTELMRLLPQAERYVGTQGGGMDQAISLGAVPGTATRIDFNPLRLVPTLVPDGWRFVVASSLAAAEKSGHAQAAYNARTRECAAALARVAAEFGGLGPASYASLVAARPVGDLLDAAKRVLDGVLLQRFRHVVTEGTRVLDAQRAMADGRLEAFGDLLDASHESLRSDYEVSTPALDELVTIARNAGAAGARLTGAGFGGCVVAVCDRSAVDRVLSELRRAFYQPRGVTGDIGGLFVAQPSGGASVDPLT
jgi:galactokinase